MTAPISTFRTTRRIEFADTDMAGIVHFARFFVFMETAEHELLRSLGAEVHMVHEDQEIGWPRRAASCEYFRPLRFGDEVEIVVRVTRKGRTSVTWESSFHHHGTLVARGEVTSVCCRVGLPGGPRPVPIPDVIADRLEEAAPREGKTG
jgi:acyl-CoA thioester hydrolase